MNDVDMNGYTMRIGWGKKVAQPTAALTLAAVQARAGPQSGATASAPFPISFPPPANVVAGAVATAAGVAIPPPPTLTASKEGRVIGSGIAPAPIQIEAPATNTRAIIDRLALYVAVEGHTFEQARPARVPPRSLRSTSPPEPRSDNRSPPS